MASEYDVLLQPTPTQKSEYDELLEQQPVAPSGAGEILKTAGKALLSTLGGFIPRSPLQAAEMATPLIGGVETLLSTPKKLSDVAFGGKTVAEAFPESQTLVEAEKTPAFSKERFEAGFGILGNIAMATGLAKGLRLRDVALGKTESPTPAVDTAVEAAKEVQPRGGEISASKITSAEGVPKPGVRTQVGEETPLRQQGEVTQARQEGTQKVVSTQWEEGAEPAAAIPGEPLAWIGNADQPKAWVTQDDATGKFVVHRDDGSVVRNPKSRDPFFDNTREAMREWSNQEPSAKAAAVSGTEMPPAAVTQIPEGAKATVNFKTASGERISREMDAREAEGIFTKEKSSYQALLDCLG